MASGAVNYAIWTGVVGTVLEYSKRKGAKWETLLMKGFLDKAIVGLLASYLQTMNVPLIGTGLDANYIYNAILAAIKAEFWRHDKGKMGSAEEQVLAALIGHRLAANFGQAFSGLSGYASGFGFINNMFAGASGYNDASIPNGGTSIPSAASGNPTSQL